MKETKLHQDQLAVIANNNGLRMYLSGLSQGREATPRSSLYNLPGKTELLEPDQILARWKHQLESLKSRSSYDEEVFHFDSAQEQKWGPQGQIAPIDDLLEDIVYPTFLSRDNFKPHADLWRRAKREVVKDLHNAGCRGLAPVSYHHVIDDMRARDTLESNSGWPLFTRRNKPEVIEASVADATNGLWKTYPAIALFRNYNQKTRLVWMFPMSANLVEGSYFQPLQQRLMTSDYEHTAKFLSPWRGFDAVREVVGRTYRTSALAIGASDFSKTDEHFKLAASLEVSDVLEECFQPRYREGLRESITHMHQIPLVISDTAMLEGEHGVSSGSNWTNFIETIFDMIFAEYVDLHSELGGAGGLFAIGDDMAWITHRSDIEELPEALAMLGKTVGQEINSEKVSADPDKVKSLQRLFVRDQLRPDGSIKAVYSTVRALKSIVYPERFHNPKLWTKDMEAVRTFMILENCVDHPMFEQFCEFVAHGDPNLATVAKWKDSKQNELHRESKRLHGLNATYNQEKRDSRLSNFESVRMIAKLG